MLQVSPEVVRRKILCMPGVWKDLDPIVKAGANRGALIELIVRAVIPRPKNSGMDSMRSKQRELKSLTMQLKTIAAFVDRVASDPHSYLEFWAPTSRRD